MITRAKSERQIEPPREVAFFTRRPSLESVAVMAGLCAVPLSIAITESFLAMALVARIVRLIRGRVSLLLPRICWLWLVWASLEVLSWLHSPRISAGMGEMRHLLLIAAMFVILPAVDRPEYKLLVWRGIFLTASLGSLALIAGVVRRMIDFRLEILLGGDPAFYLRNGGFLHHWMIYSTVEIMIFGALLEFRLFYPEERRWMTPALFIHCLAILLSLTRTLWLGCLLIAGIHLIRRRSKVILALPALLLAAFLLAPGAVRSRIADSSHADYYSNAERVQMWRAGWKMIREHPVFGVGPGRVEELYTSYLPAGEPVPAYHGHLHNNALQLAAQFGLPVLGAAAFWLAALLKDLMLAWKRARSPESRLLCRSAFLGITGFLIAGMTDYSYGHALGLILFSFVAISPLIAQEANRSISLKSAQSGSVPNARPESPSSLDAQNASEIAGGLKRTSSDA
jgi:O-antigen ligase